MNFSRRGFHNSKHWNLFGKQSACRGWIRNRFHRHGKSRMGAYVYSTSGLVIETHESKYPGSSMFYKNQSVIGNIASTPEYCGGYKGRAHSSELVLVRYRRPQHYLDYSEHDVAKDIQYLDEGGSYYGTSWVSPPPKKWSR